MAEDFTPAPDPLVTVLVSINRDGTVYQSTTCHGNPWADVYRGICAVRDVVLDLIDKRRQCPFNPKSLRTDIPKVFKLKKMLADLEQEGYNAASMNPIPPVPVNSEIFREAWLTGFYRGVVDRTPKTRH